MYSLISAVTAGFLALGPATPVPTQPSAPLSKSTCQRMKLLP